MILSKIKKIQPLIIGIGVAGKRHLEAQLKLGHKTGVYTTNPQTAKSLRKNKNIIVFDNLREGIDWSNLVHVCTPDDKHTKFVEMAIKKGKAVLCEKSFTTNLKEAIYLQNLAHKYKSTLVIGQNYRLTPTFAEIKKRAIEGQLGTITKIETTYFHDASDYKKRYQNKNFLYIGGSHAVDLMLFIIDKSVVSIKATSTKSNSNYPQSYEITLKFSSGLLGHIQLDASKPQAKNGTDLIVKGEKGKLVSHNKEDKLYIYKGKNAKPKYISLPNKKTYTTALEIKIVDDYLLGKIKSFW